MKIIEALKKVKDLKRKASDLQDKVHGNTAIMDFQKEKYENQGKKIQSWIDSHKDVLKEIERLKLAIQKTNFATDVPINFEKNTEIRSISAWIMRRHEIAAFEKDMWKGINDCGYQDTAVKDEDGKIKPAYVKRFYKPEIRDKVLEKLNSEPSLIDSTLEVINATTDLIEN